MRSKLRFLTPLLVAGAAAAAIAAAPSASANVNPTECNSKGAASHCQRSGHSSIHVSPPARAQQPFGFRLGFTPLNPGLLAID